MSSLKALQVLDTPSREIPRIFVGNLNHNITDSSLRTLLSRFGSIDDFSRSSCATYAHLSLNADEAALNNCISSLNRVKWFGTSLRVERAKQYYLHRLLDEWQQASVHCKTESVAVEGHQEANGPSKPPFHNMPKGAHVRFPFADDELSRRPSPVSLDKHRSDCDDARQTAQMQKNLSAFRSKEHTLQTTISLFGLSTARTRPRNENRTPTDTPVQPATKRARPASNEKPGPVPSSHTTDPQVIDSPSEKVPPDTVHQPYSVESAKAVEEDPTKIDLQRERNTSLSIYRSMFTDQIAPRSNAQLRSTASHTELDSPKAAPFRRAALYTKLQSTDKETLTSSHPMSKRNKRVNECAQREELARDSHGRTHFTAPCRRTALYKSLQAHGTQQIPPTNSQTQRVGKALRYQTVQNVL